MACGTGIKKCGFIGFYYEPWLLYLCANDPRTTWRGLTIATDLEGNRTWSRMDNYQTDGLYVESSTAEYILSDKENQKLTYISDELGGIGIATISAPNG